MCSHGSYHYGNLVESSQARWKEMCQLTAYLDAG
jgi:hypothetical protein